MEATINISINYGTAAVFIHFTRKDKENIDLFFQQATFLENCPIYKLSDLTSCDVESYQTFWYPFFVCVFFF